MRLERCDSLLEGHNPLLHPIRERDRPLVLDRDPIRQHIPPLQRADDFVFRISYLGIRRLLRDLGDDTVQRLACGRGDGRVARVVRRERERRYLGVGRHLKDEGERYQVVWGIERVDCKG